MVFPVLTPKVTFLLLSYNQEAYIDQAIDGAFAQDYESLEIFISDDCSSDLTLEKIKLRAANYTGPHSVVVRRTERNSGLASHINKAMKEVSGELIVVAAGDDISRSDRVKTLVSNWLDHGKFDGSIFSSYVPFIDFPVDPPRKSYPKPLKIELGNFDSLKEFENVFVGTRGCAHAWTKSVFEVFGDMDEQIQHEDITIPLRSIMLGGILFLEQELVEYRVGHVSISRMHSHNYKKRFQRMTRYWLGRISNYDQFEKDSSTAMARTPQNRTAIEKLRNLVAAKQVEATAMHDFFRSGPIGRISLILSGRTGWSLAQKIKYLIIALVPPFYSIKWGR